MTKHERNINNIIPIILMVGCIHGIELHDTITASFCGIFSVLFLIESWREAGQ